MIIDVTDKIGELFFSTEQELNEITVGQIKKAPPKFSLNFSIHCDPDDEKNFYQDPYIKIIDNTSWSKANNIVRIYLIDMGLDYSHKIRERKGPRGDLILNAEWKKELNLAMDEISAYKLPDAPETDLTVKEAIIGFLAYKARNAGKYDELPKVLMFNFKKCYIRAGKEPMKGMINK